jgi:uncharacterized protein YjiS (DUF1127 family)
MEEAMTFPSLRLPLFPVQLALPRLRRLRVHLRDAETRRRQARNLENLDARLLRDIGVSSGDVAEEVRRLYRL